MSSSDDCANPETKPAENSPAPENLNAVASGPDAQNAANVQKNRRKSAITASLEALNYLSHLSRKRLRHRDKTSDILLGIAILMLIPLTLDPYQNFQMPLALICDIICFVTVVWFLINRLGILRTLSERQSVLIWDITVGVFILSIVLCINYIVLFRALLGYHPS